MKKEYRKIINETKIIGVNELIDISIKLFEEIKIIDLINDDMLLFQYGTYDWGDENGEHFEIDISRQIFSATEDEPYCMSVTLIFEPVAFAKIESYSEWSDGFDTTEAFSQHIKSTPGYMTANKEIAKNIRIIFEQA